MDSHEEGHQSPNEGRFEPFPSDGVPDSIFPNPAMSYSEAFAPVSETNPPSADVGMTSSSQSALLSRLMKLDSDARKEFSQDFKMMNFSNASNPGLDYILSGPPATSNPSLQHLMTPDTSNNLFWSSQEQPQAMPSPSKPPLFRSTSQQRNQFYDSQPQIPGEQHQRQQQEQQQEQQQQVLVSDGTAATPYSYDPRSFSHDYGNDPSSEPGPSISFQPASDGIPHSNPGTFGPDEFIPSLRKMTNSDIEVSKSMQSFRMSGGFIVSKFGKISLSPFLNSLDDIQYPDSIVDVNDARIVEEHNRCAPELLEAMQAQLMDEKLCLFLTDREPILEISRDRILAGSEIHTAFLEIQALTDALSQKSTSSQASASGSPVPSHHSNHPKGDDSKSQESYREDDKQPEFAQSTDSKKDKSKPDEMAAKAAPEGNVRRDKPPPDGHLIMGTQFLLIPHSTYGKYSLFAMFIPKFGHVLAKVASGVSMLDQFSRAIMYQNDAKTELWFHMFIYLEDGSLLVSVMKLADQVQHTLSVVLKFKDTDGILPSEVVRWATVISQTLKTRQEVQEFVSGYRNEQVGFPPSSGNPDFLSAVKQEAPPIASLLPDDYLNPPQPMNIAGAAPGWDGYMNQPAITYMRLVDPSGKKQSVLKMNAIRLCRVRDCVGISAIKRKAIQQLQNTVEANFHEAGEVGDVEYFSNQDLGAILAGGSGNDAAALAHGIAGQALGVTTGVDGVVVVGAESTVISQSAQDRVSRAIYIIDSNLDSLNTSPQFMYDNLSADEIISLLNKETPSFNEAKKLTSVLGAAFTVNDWLGLIRNYDEAMEIKAFPCDICGFRFRKKNDMRRHVDLVHMNRKDFECGVCHGKFGRESNLFRHLRRIHGASKPINCKRCKNGFPDQAVFTEHTMNGSCTQKVVSKAS
mmetsp:Transcript_17742/g.30810  ORF Transcript_17742/g.30810 Transcript_17742/m.30810 type:complete len:913 (+) Transcript_17742:85-2823(+)